VIERDAKVQLSVMGKVGRTRQVLLPAVVSASLLALRGDASANDPVFASHKGGRRLTERTGGYMLKRAAKRAGIAETVSPHLAASRPRQPRP
jgi:integrase/recombinase XerD